MRGARIKFPIYIPPIILANFTHCYSHKIKLSVILTAWPFNNVLANSCLTKDLSLSKIYPSVFGDRELNRFQINAVKEALRKTFTLIQGPPGKEILPVSSRKPVVWSCNILLFVLYRYRKDCHWNSRRLLVCSNESEKQILRILLWTLQQVCGCCCSYVIYHKNYYIFSNPFRQSIASSCILVCSLVYFLFCPLLVSYKYGIQETISIWP